MSKAAIGSGERLGSIYTAEHTTAISGEQHARGVARVDHHVVHDDIWSGHGFGSLAGVGRSPQSFRGTGVNDLRIVRVLHQHAGTTRRERHALHLVELFTGINAVVNTGTRAGVNVRRALGIDDYG